MNSKNAALSIAALILSFSALGAQAASVLPGHLPARSAGNYRGQGDYLSTSQTPGLASGNYQIETQITQGGRLTSSYHFTSGVSNLELVFRFKSAQAFIVEAAGQVVGHGYCREVQCHYEIQALPGLPGGMEETLSFVGPHLYKLGSKAIEGGVKIFWQETLDRQP